MVNVMNAKVIRAADRYLVSDNVRLRLISLSDCNKQYVAWLNDPEVNQYLETRWHKQTASMVVEFVTAQLASDNSYLFAIIEKKSDKHIGNIKLGPINFHHQNAEISYFIGDKACWGRGYARQALRCVVAFAFNVLSLHCLKAGVYAENKASINVLASAGFQRIGCYPRAMQSSNGWEDHVLFALLNNTDK